MANGEWEQQVGRNGARNLSTRRCRSEPSAAAGFLRAPLCPAGHLPHTGGDWLPSGAARSPATRPSRGGEALPRLPPQYLPDGRLRQFGAELDVARALVPGEVLAAELHDLLGSQVRV